MPDKISLDERQFSLVKVQRDGETAIYRSDDVFMRIGNTRRILRDMAMHNEMVEAGFPVANIIEEGELNGKHYFLEESLGDKNFSTMFAESLTAGGYPLDETFSKFLAVIKKFLQAQVNTSVHANFAGLREGTHVDTLCEECPEDSDMINKRFTEAVSVLQKFPFVVSHGDLNPHNTHARGIIDLEDSFHAPFGYDAVCAIEHVNMFPLEEGYEMKAEYRFSQEQRQQYYKTVDQLCMANNIQKISSSVEHFKFLRTVWSATRMHKWPKIREWRLEKLHTEFLN